MNFEDDLKQGPAPEPGYDHRSAPPAAEAPAPEDWAKVSLFGHRERRGRISEVERFGSKFLRIDIPMFDANGEPDGEVSEFYGGGAIYGIEPQTKNLIMDYQRRWGEKRPEHPLSYSQRPALLEQHMDDGDDDEPLDEERPF